MFPLFLIPPPPPLSHSRLRPVFLSALLAHLLLLRRSLLVSPLGFPLIPGCSSLFSSTNDGNHPQTHQLTLFQSYRTTPFTFPSPSILFSLSPSACYVSSFTTGHAASHSGAESVVVSRVVFVLKQKAGHKHPHKRLRP